LTGVQGVALWSASHKERFVSIPPARGSPLALSFV